MYDAWGNLISSTGETENSYLYCGEQLDSTTGLYYLRTRYMNPTTGTFITQDTYAGTIFDPTSLHKYLYANANPVTYCDPSGYSSYAAEQNAAMIIMGNLSEMVSTAASVAWNFYLKFKASMPMLVASATGMAAFLSNSPVFMDICARFASGDLTVPELCNQIIETFNIIDQSVWDHIYEATNRGHSSSSSGSSSGGNGASGNFDPNKWLQKVKNLTLKFSDSQLGKKWGEHMKDYPNLKSYKEYKNYAQQIMDSPDSIIVDVNKGEYYFIKGIDLLRVQFDGNFVSLYHGANTDRVINAINAGGQIF